MPSIDGATPRLERYGLGCALGIFLATRAIVLLVACLTPQDRSPDRPNAPTWWSDTPLMAWDAGHYLAILRTGYPEQINDTVAFFPAYPLLARPLVPLLGAELALLLVANLTGLAGVCFFYLWARDHSGVRVALLAVLLLSVYPLAMFLSAGYTEGPFLLCVALVFWLLDRGRIGWAALVSGLATATRPTGVALAAVVVLWALVRVPIPWPRRLVRVAVVGVVSISGLLAHEAYLTRHYGRWDAYFAAQKSWQPRTEPAHPVRKALELTPIIKPSLRPVRAVIYGEFGQLLEPGTWNVLFNTLAVGLAIYGLVRPGRIPRLTFLLPIFIFLMAYLPDPVLGTRMVGIARYQLVALPCFLLAARWPGWQRAPWALAALALGLMALQCVHVQQFCNWIQVS